MKESLVSKDGPLETIYPRIADERRPMQELEVAFKEIVKDKKFQKRFNFILKTYAGRPTPLMEVKRFGQAIWAKSRIFLKREDLLHTGAHKLNNTLGQ